MANIPERFIREKKINFEDEILSCYGMGIKTHGFDFPPLTLGVMSMLELLDNKLFKGEDATVFDFFVIFYIAKKKKKSVKLVAQYVRGYKKPLERAVKLFAVINRLSILSMPRIKELIESAFYGFDMLPKGGGSSAFIYGAETISNLSYVCCEKLNKTYEEILWDTPLTLIGHIVASNAIINGAKGVGRRKDEDHIKKIFAKCKEWDEQEKLYPWQWLEPNIYRLEPYQNSVRIKKAHAKRLKEVKNA